MYFNLFFKKQFAFFGQIMDELNINIKENFDSSESSNIEQIRLAKLAMERVRQSIYQKVEKDPKISFLLKRL